MKITTTPNRFGFRRALEIDGEQVSWLNVHDLKMRIGPAVVRVGGIGGVATSGRHRMKGYSRKVMEDTTVFMREQGYDVALLYGIDNFYHKFGYAPCMPGVTGSIRTRDAEAVGRVRGFRIRGAREGDFRAIAALYAKNVDGRTMMLLRTAKTIATIHHGSDWRRGPETFVVEGPVRRFAGYFIRDAAPAPTTLCEVETKSPEALKAVLAALARMAVERRDGEIAFRLPSDHAMALLMRRFGCKVTVEHRSTGGAMGRILNQDALLAKLSDAYRCDCPDMCRMRRFPVEVITELGATRLMVPGEGPRKRSRLTIPAMTLFQLITGFREASEVLSAPGVKATGRGAEAAEFLHPGHEPHMYVVDHF